jgi:hypothetical protein
LRSPPQRLASRSWLEDDPCSFSCEPLAQSSERLSPRQVLDITEGLVAGSPTISLPVWSLFPLICQAHQTFAYDYLENMLPVLAKYFENGADLMCSLQCPGDFHGMVYAVVKSVLANEDAAEQDCCDGVWLACSLIQYCNGKMDTQIPQYLELALQELRKEVAMDQANPAGKKDTSSLKRVYLNLIANVMCYNPVLCLQLLEKAQCTAEIFQLWSLLFWTYENAAAREQQTAVMAFSNLMRLPVETMPSALQEQLPKLLETMVWMCGLIQAGGEDGEDGEDGDFGEEGGDEEEFEGYDDDDLDDDEDIRRSRTGMPSEMDFAKMFGDDFDFDGDDDDSAALPLDGVDAVTVFTSMMSAMQSEAPGTFNTLYGNMNDDNKARLQAIGQAAQSPGDA